MEVLSEHLCEGWLEGYLLTGRHGLFSCYEAFIHIVDSMFNQHAKWLEACNSIPWRQPIASLNYLLTSHVWQQDHNGFSHQDPGFIDHVANKTSRQGRPDLPAAGRQHPAVGDRPLPAQPQLCEPDRRRQGAGMAVARHRRRRPPLRRPARGRLGLGQFDPGDPEVVMACCGDVPTTETLAAVTLLRDYAPDLNVRVVNIVDLMVPGSVRPASPRPGRRRFRPPVHRRQAGDLRLPRLSRASCTS